LPKVSDLFPPDRLKATELTGPITVVIRSALLEKPGYGGGTEQALEIEMDGRLRVMKVGSMLANDIAAVLKADESLNWIGKAIAIYPFQLTIKGKDEAVTMIRAMAATEVLDGIYSSNGHHPLPKQHNDLNDDIPY
jgi:hypothetical protein